MAIYICKCGRQVNKSTNADNTGNRDTDGCTGCPYLLPWGPDKYIEGQGFRKEVQGFECRMSPTISYTTTYNGQANDKCTLHILSLDLDFLDTVQAWIDDHAADTLSAGFSRGGMRGTDFSNKGRYSLSISCAQNKKGMAAKAALIEQFFTGGRVRKDMTLVQEKAHILAAIKRGKENASKMNYIISEHQNGLMYAYYKGQFWFWHKDQNKWVPSAFATQQYDKAKAKDSGITPEMLLDNGSFNVLEEYQVPLQRRTALEALTPADSQAPAPDDREIAKAPPAAAPASAEPPEIVDECSEPDEECPYLQPLENSKKYSWQCSLCGDKFVNREICNKSFRGCGWYQDQQEKDARQDDEEEPSVTDSCQCRTCEHESCFAHGCTKECPANAEESCLTTSCPEYAEGKDSQCKVKTESVPTMDAAAITDERAAKGPSKVEETSTTSVSGADAGTSLPESSCKSGPNLSPAPASPADAGAAAQNLCAAEPASLEAKDINVPTFDFGADADTNTALMQDAQIFMAGSMARVMAAKRAHDRTANNYRGSWGKWCDLVGISRDTGDNMVRVAENFGNMELDGKPLIEAAPFSLLAVAAKPSAPAELVQAVKDGDITSHKQYQDALAEIRARDAKIKDLLEMSEAADRRADAAQTERDAADARARAAEKERDEACKERDGAKSALQASKLRGDRLKAENDDLKARPIEVPAVDEEEIDRRVNARLQQAVYASQEERRQIDARNAEDAILLLGRQINTAWQMVRPFLAEMEESRRVEAIDRINREWAQTQKEIMQCL